MPNAVTLKWTHRAMLKSFDTLVSQGGSSRANLTGACNRKILTFSLCRNGLQTLVWLIQLSFQKIFAGKFCEYAVCLGIFPLHCNDGWMLAFSEQTASHHSSEF